MNWRWLLLIPIIWACDDYNDCGISDYSEELYLGFYDYEDGGTKEVEFASVLVTYASGKSVLQTVPESDEPIVGFSLPVDLADTVTNYLFISDTVYHLQLTYRREAILENPDCGPVFRIKGVNAFTEEDDDIMEFDSVAVQVLELSKLVAPHVEVYF